MSRALFCLLLAVSVFAQENNFHGYVLYSVYVRDVGDAEFLNQLGENYADLDFWIEPAPERKSTVLVSPGLLEIFQNKAVGQGLELVVLSDDVQGIVDAGNVRTPLEEVNKLRQAQGKIVDHFNYHRYVDIHNFLQQLASAYPNNMELSSLDFYTHESLMVDLVILRGNPGTNKPAIIVESGIHAREWIVPAANLWVIEKLLQDYAAGDANAMFMLDKYDWYFVPVTNPDGYEYSHTNYRLWRKNRRYISNRCTGVDLNRNFDVVFGTTGVSNSCDSDIYPGPSPFSEPETANMRNLFNNLQNRLVSYLSVHAYSQFVLVPWGYTNYVSRPENAAELDRVTLQMTDAISNRHGKTYLHGTAWQLLNYAASGAAEDWALTQKPGIYAMCFELRPDANDPRGFVIPANEIVGTGEEYLDALIVLANEMNV